MVCRHPGALASADLEDSRATQKILRNKSSASFRVLLGRVSGDGRQTPPHIKLPFIFELDKALFPREMMHHLCPARSSPRLFTKSKIQKPLI